MEAGLELASTGLRESLVRLLEHERAFKAQCADLASADGPEVRGIQLQAAALRSARAEVGRAVAAAVAQCERWSLEVGQDGVSVIPVADAPVEPVEAVETVEEPPEEEVENAVEPPSPPATPESLQRLAAQWGGQREADEEPETERLPLHWLARPVAISDAVELEHWVRLLERATADVGDWLRWPTRTQNALLTLVACIIRHLRDYIARVELPPGIEARLGDCMGRARKLTEMNDKVSGHGLWPQNQPRSESWLLDSQRAWDVLFGDPAAQRTKARQAVLDAVENGEGDSEVVRATVEALAAGVSSEDKDLLGALVARRHLFFGRTERGVRTLRNHLKAYAWEDEEEEEVAQPVPALPDEWAWRNLVKGSRVLTLGGDRRARSEERWTALFGFHSVEWETGWEMRRVQSAASRVKSGSYDLVILVTRFCTHKASRLVVGACNDHGIPFVPVDGGYGVDQIRRAIERLPLPG